MNRYDKTLGTWSKLIRRSERRIEDLQIELKEVLRKEKYEFLKTSNYQMIEGKPFYVGDIFDHEIDTYEAAIGFIKEDIERYQSMIRK